MSPLIAKLFPRDNYRVLVSHENGWKDKNPEYNWKTTVKVFDCRTLEPICEGVAVCSKNDQPVRRTGFLMAVKRAYGALKSIQNISLENVNV